jgi:hypothetical protein
MTRLTFNAPQLISKHFIVSPDLTHWAGSCMNYSQLLRHDFTMVG